MASEFQETTSEDSLTDSPHRLTGSAPSSLLYPICLRHPALNALFIIDLFRHLIFQLPSFMTYTWPPCLFPIPSTRTVLSFPNRFLPFLSISSFNSILSFRSNYPLSCLFLGYLIPLFSQSQNAFFGLLSRSFRPLNYITLLGTGAFPCTLDLVPEFTWCVTRHQMTIRLTFL